MRGVCSYSPASPRAGRAPAPSPVGEQPSSSSSSNSGSAGGRRRSLAAHLAHPHRTTVDSTWHHHGRWRQSMGGEGSGSPAFHLPRWTPSWQLRRAGVAPHTSCWPISSVDTRARSIRRRTMTGRDRSIPIQWPIRLPQSAGSVHWIMTGAVVARVSRLLDLAYTHRVAIDRRLR